MDDEDGMAMIQYADKCANSTGNYHQHLLLLVLLVITSAISIFVLLFISTGKYHIVPSFKLLFNKENQDDGPYHQHLLSLHLLPGGRT